MVKIKYDIPQVRNRSFQEVDQGYFTGRILSQVGLWLKSGHNIVSMESFGTIYRIDKEIKDHLVCDYVPVEVEITVVDVRKQKKG